jgi:hypothetical protein
MVILPSGYQTGSDEKTMVDPIAEFAVTSHHSLKHRSESTLLMAYLNLDLMAPAIVCQPDTGVGHRFKSGSGF